MLVRHFDPFGRRVPDPMRPGRTAVVTELRPSKTTQLQYTDDSGETVTVEPRPDGWFDVPEEVGRKLCRHRTPGARGIGGGGFYTDAEVDEKYGLGVITEAVAPSRDEPTVAAPQRPPAARPGPTTAAAPAADTASDEE